MSNKKKQKSMAKAIGLKSTFTIGDKLLLTTFGDANYAEPEKDIENLKVVNRQDPETFSANCKDNNINLHNAKNNMKTYINNPLVETTKKMPEETISFKQRVKNKKAEIKGKYEELYFGKKYDDNIHIQLAYKILDIEKTFTITTNNIVYAFRNMLKRCDSYKQGMDIFDSENSYTIEEKDKLYGECVYNGVYLFGDIEKPSKNRSMENIVKDRKEEIEKAIKIVRILRNDAAHGFDIKNKKKYSPNKRKFNLFNQNEDIQRAIRSPFTMKLSEIKTSFWRNSQANLKILDEYLYAGSLTEKQKNEMAQDWFVFSVLKENKNIGINITTIRELLLKKYNFDFESDGNIRGRKNNFCDFAIYRYYKENTEELKYIVDLLRASRRDEDKELIYNNLVNDISYKFKEIYTAIADLDSSDFKELSTLKDTIGVSYGEIKFPFERFSIGGDIKRRENATYFCNLVYFMSQFIDGKEINIFITDLINDFENINSFEQLMRQEKIECNFVEQFSMFSDASYIVEMLKTIRSLARMKKTFDCCTWTTLRDAVLVLGGTEDSVDDYMKNHLFSENNGTKDHNLRNFLISNVIKSRDFCYLMRYTNPDSVKSFIHNRKLVHYVLVRIEDSNPNMITRYYNSIFKDNEKSRNVMIDKLIDEMTKITVSEFEKVKNDNNQSKQGLEMRESSRQIIGLYLTILYQIIKNLVYINSRYVLGFAFAERDIILEGINDYDANNKMAFNDYNVLSDKYIEEGLVKIATPAIRESIEYLKGKNGNDDLYNKAIESLKHIPGEYYKVYKAGYDKNMARVFRNQVAHLNMFSSNLSFIDSIKDVTSYYQLYHFCMQMYLLQNNVDGIQNDILKQSLLKAQQSGEYSKDAVKYLCLPFFYNLARFKSLTTKELFDWSDYSKEEE